MMSLIETIGPYDPVISVLEELATSSENPVNWRRPMYCVIDQLHALSASEDKIYIAERIAVALLQLDWAILKGNSEKQEQVRQQLASLGATWRSNSGPSQPLEVESDNDVLELHEVETITAALERIGRAHH